jgi:penicillin amidase
MTPGRHASGPFAIASNAADWDRSTVLSAPGQSGSPDSAHFSDFAERWAAGEPAELAFTNAAVQAVAESTLTLTVRVP